MKKRILSGILGSAVALLAAGCGDAGAGEGQDQLVISTYGNATSTYADVAAVANELTANEGISVRIITSDTSVGRFTPLVQGQADLVRTGDDHIFAFEGDFDFADPQWGPQDIRVVWSPLIETGLMVRDDSGIESYEDLRGRKVPRVTANPSVNIKIEAALAYAGLTWDDVEPVDIGYSDQPGALQAGKIDVLFHAVYGASLQELASAIPVRWLDMEPDPEKVAAAQEVAPTILVREFSGAPGQEENEKTHGLFYPLPVVAEADADEDEVYGIIKAVVANYDNYKDVTPTTEGWSPDAVMQSPVSVPFHAGLVKYFQDEGIWTAEAQEAQDRLVERGEALRSQWKDFLAERSGDGDLGKSWTAWKNEHVEP
jgi:TRAP transporter TAXI family solute receptor